MQTKSNPWSIETVKGSLVGLGIHVYTYHKCSLVGMPYIRGLEPKSGPYTMHNDVQIAMEV